MRTEKCLCDMNADFKDGGSGRKQGMVGHWKLVKAREWTLSRSLLKSPPSFLCLHFSLVKPIADFWLSAILEHRASLF